MTREFYANWPIGRFEIRVVFRRVNEDQGVTIHLFGPANGNREEVLRFDCFEHQPHYHLGCSYRDEPFIAITAPDPFEWTLEVLESPNELLFRAGAESMDEDELSAMPKSIDLIRISVVKLRTLANDAMKRR